MKTRREFIIKTTAVAIGSTLLPSFGFAPKKQLALGVQLYTFRDEMLKDPAGTLKKIAALGIKKIETAGSNKGYYYGLQPKEMQSICRDLGMELISGHVRLDDKWEQTMEQALAAGQEYLICSSLPSRGQDVDNYKKVAEAFNKAGEACNKLGLKFGYHNHEYEFETVDNTVLFDVLMDNTTAELVHMELDLGWVIIGGKDPLDYFKKYPGRFPLWHLKDMDMNKKHSTELGKGGLDIDAMIANMATSGVGHIFIEQEEYALGPFESMTQNMDFMKKYLQ